MGREKRRPTDCSADHAMCLMLYIGSGLGLTIPPSPELTLEPVDGARLGVVQWFSQPVVQFVGAHTGCSCGFPSVVAETVIEHYDGIWAQSEDRSSDLRSVEALIRLLRVALESRDAVELYPVSDGDEALGPKGVVEWFVEHLAPETFLFNEQFMHVVRRANETAQPGHAPAQRPAALCATTPTALAGGARCSANDQGEARCEGA